MVNFNSSLTIICIGK